MHMIDIMITERTNTLASPRYGRKIDNLQGSVALTTVEMFIVYEIWLGKILVKIHNARSSRACCGYEPKKEEGNAPKQPRALFLG